MISTPDLKSLCPVTPDKAETSRKIKRNQVMQYQSQTYSSQQKKSRSPDGRHPSPDDLQAKRYKKKATLSNFIRTLEKRS